MCSVRCEGTGARIKTVLALSPFVGSGVWNGARSASTPTLDPIRSERRQARERAASRRSRRRSSYEQLSVDSPISESAADRRLRPVSWRSGLRGVRKAYRKDRRRSAWPLRQLREVGEPTPSEVADAELDAFKRDVETLIPSELSERLGDAHAVLRSVARPGGVFSPRHGRGP